jgi:hypothetical protein
MRKVTALPFLIACLIAALAPFAAPSPAPADTASFPGWPAQFEGRPIHPLPLTETERRFSDGFPGRVGRFTDGEREIIMRWVLQPTRKLHPAADCFKGIGYTIRPLPIEVVAGANWSAFEAHRENSRLHIREIVIGSDHESWTDMSTWYWSASHGPWWAITVATAR